MIAVGLGVLIAYNIEEAQERAQLSKLKAANKICYRFPGDGVQSQLADRALSLRMNQVSFQKNGSIPGYDVELAVTELDEAHEPVDVSIMLFDQTGKQTAYETIASFTRNELAKSESRVIRAELSEDLEHQPFAYAIKVR